MSIGHRRTAPSWGFQSPKVRQLQQQQFTYWISHNFSCSFNRLRHSILFSLATVCVTWPPVKLLQNGAQHFKRARSPIPENSSTDSDVIFPLKFHFAKPSMEDEAKYYFKRPVWQVIIPHRSDKHRRKFTVEGRTYHFLKWGTDSPILRQFLLNLCICYNFCYT